MSGTHHRGPNADKLITFPEGAAWAEPAGSPHMERCGSESDCVLAGHMDGALDTKAVESTPEKAAPARESQNSVFSAQARS